ncbi:MAG: hypothetical protein ACTHJ0_05785 [Flavipsychrobacter sp.]
MKYFIKAYAVVALLPVFSFAQTQKAASLVDLNKETGLVKVKGKPQFYIERKNAIAWEADYRVDDLQHKEIAYFKLEKGYHYSTNIHNHDQVQYYTLTFTQTSAHCDVRDFLNSPTIIKSLATLLVKEKLVQDGNVNDAEVNRYIEANRGFSTVTYGDSTQKQLADTSLERQNLTGAISMKEGFIYYNQQSIGSYQKTDIDTDLVLIQVFALNRQKVAEVTHATGDEDWTIITVVDQDRKTLKYDADKPLETLFMFLLRKKYL